MPAKSGATQTALRCVGVRSPQRCFCLRYKLRGEYRKAKTARAGSGKISVRKFMQNEFLPIRLIGNKSFRLYSVSLEEKRTIYNMLHITFQEFL